MNDPSGLLGGVAIPYWLATTPAIAALPKPQNTFMLTAATASHDVQNEIAKLCSNLMEVAKYSSCRNEILNSLRGVCTVVSGIVNRDINTLTLNIDTQNMSSSSSSSSSSSANQICNPLLKEQTPQPGKHHYIIIRSSLYHHYIITISSLYHHYVMTISSLYHHYNITISSSDHHYIITISSSNHRYIITMS